MQQQTRTRKIPTRLSLISFALVCACMAVSLALVEQAPSALSCNEAGGSALCRMMITTRKEFMPVCTGSLCEQRWSQQLQRVRELNQAVASIHHPGQKVRFDIAGEAWRLADTVCKKQLSASPNESYYSTVVAMAAELNSLMDRLEGMQKSAVARVRSCSVFIRSPKSS